MLTWRLLKTETHDAFMNMAVDESILKNRIENLVPNTLRLYSWKPSAVSIGRFQDAKKEVQVEDCKKYGVDIVRRITGGGAVYHDSDDELTYSLIVRRIDLMTDDIGRVYARIYSGLAEALKTLGVKADFNRGDPKTCPNLTVNGRKISGSAQAHRKGVVLQHGTLLSRVDLVKMFTFLRVPWARTCMQVAKIAENKITSIDSETGRNVPTSEIVDALIAGFEKTFKIRLEADSLAPKELEVATYLRKEKYATDRWNFSGHN
jgi:lipoate-protein ligase A